MTEIVVPKIKRFVALIEEGEATPALLQALGRLGDECPIETASCIAAIGAQMIQDGEDAATTARVLGTLRSAVRLSSGAGLN